MTPGERERIFKTKSGSDVKFTRHPRFGSWSVSFSRGAIPASLAGDWLEFDLLYEKTKHYLRTRKDNPTELIEAE